MLDRYVERNGISVHIVDTEAMDRVYSFPIEAASDKFTNVIGDIYITTQLTFGDMAQFVLGDSTYDFALPQSFWNSRSDWRDHVWYYEQGDHMGQPYNVRSTFMHWINVLLAD